MEHNFDTGETTQEAVSDKEILIMMTTKCADLERQLAKREDDYRKLRKRSDEQIERLKDESESYKCDNQVLIEIISDCLNKWNKYEAFEVLKEVNEYYKLKEQNQ